MGLAAPGRAKLRRQVSPGVRSRRCCLGGLAGPGVDSRARTWGSSLDRGARSPRPEREGEARCRRALFEKKTKSFGGQGLPGRLSRNSCRLLTEIYQVLYGSVIPLPAVVFNLELVSANLL